MNIPDRIHHVFVLVFAATWLLTTLNSCSASRPRHGFEHYAPPPAPDYSDPLNWAALPTMVDAADSTPAGLKDIQELSQADVFFLYPTTYLTKRGNDQWNADVHDDKLNRFTDASTILYQASLFNGVGKVYAPRYRQVHYHSFFTRDSASAEKAFDLAYGDIKAAFEYFLEHFNKNRPIILAGHSQGAAHLIRLMEDYFDNDDLRRRLVVSYAVGFPVPLRRFEVLKPCRDEYDVGCICSWRSVKKGHEPKWCRNDPPVVITNPLDWSTDAGRYVPKDKNLGSVLDGMDKPPVPGMSGAEIYKGILWVDKPKFKGSFLYPFANFHRGDFNIFYMNVRENAMQRLNAFWRL
ncbi:MAG TPA: DUF3089 domain-containing protein [Saprospiraceae bacterium]|nr:DUF3089 domain-containing protein [Saprospiraceae bacterium]